MNRFPVQRFTVEKYKAGSRFNGSGGKIRVRGSCNRYQGSGFRVQEIRNSSE